MTLQITPPPEDESPVAATAPGAATLARCPVTGALATPAPGAVQAPGAVGAVAPGAVTAPAVDPAEAEAFVRQHHAEADLPDVEVRVREVLEDLDTTGSYTHTLAELTFATRVAWRNAGRCVGRLPWAKLAVRDRRHLEGGAAIAADCVGHLREAWNGGAIRPTISVYRAAAPGTAGPRVWNPQLIRYAGYRHPDGTVTGDPSTVDLTSYLRTERGWSGPGTRFDVLPLLVTDSGETTPSLLELPADAVQEVPISHPEHPSIAAMGLRWHALPVISDQRLEAGGLWYTCAPFSGWYLADEIGARNFADADRYDLLPEVGERLGLDVGPGNPYWRDLAQVELTRAVHHSFKRARVSVADHHSEDKRLMSFVRSTRRRQQPVDVEWGWVTPPFGGSLTEAWHALYNEPGPDPLLRPAYVHQAPPGALAPDAGSSVDRT